MNSKMNEIIKLIKQHEKYRVHSCINLRADENYTSSYVRNCLTSDLCHRNISPDPRFIYRGTKYMKKIEKATVGLGKKLFQANYLNVLAATGHTANIITFFTFCKPGDKILVLAPENGGYGGIARDNLPKNLGIEVLYFPFDQKKMNIDVERTIQLIQNKQLSLIVFGATYPLFPNPVREIAEIAHHHRIPLAYDASHVLGLIAGKQFQDPLHEGADLLFGSTMKTLGGTPGGILITNKKDVYMKLNEATFYKATTNVHWNRVAALGVRFAEMLESGENYAYQIIKNAKALANALSQQGVKVMFKELGYTASHLFLLDVGGFKKNISGEASVEASKLEDANIIIDDRGRIGVAEVTRLGMKEIDMNTIAELIAKVLVQNRPTEKILDEVKKLRSKFKIK